MEGPYGFEVLHLASRSLLCLVRYDVNVLVCICLKSLLCDGSIGGSVRCSGLGGGCAGAATGTVHAGVCYPFDIWAFVATGDGSYPWGYLQGGGLGVDILPGTLAFSVRSLLIECNGHDGRGTLKLLAVVRPQGVLGRACLGPGLRPVLFLCVTEDLRRNVISMLTG